MPDQNRPPKSYDGSIFDALPKPPEHWGRERRPRPDLDVPVILVDDEGATAMLRIGLLELLDETIDDLAPLNRGAFVPAVDALLARYDVRERIR